MTTKAAILRSIRAKCLDCSGHRPSEVRNCSLTDCGLWPYRMGEDPEPSTRRGFAKPPAYTGDSVCDDADAYPGSGRGAYDGKPPLDTGGLEASGSI